MCWSANGSLGAYSLAMGLAALTKYQGKLDPKLWLFLVIFSHVQLVEYFLWKNLKIPRLNAMWSAIGLAVILAEPAASLNMLSDKRLLALYVIGAMTYIMTNRINFSTVVGANGHLKWNWITPALNPYGIAWVLALLLPLYLTKEYAGLAFGIVVFGISMYYNYAYGTIASYWCWLALGAWVLVLLRKKKS